MEQERLLQSSKAPGASRISRPQDISSDEEEDDPEFEPVVVTRTSPEGLMMSKWLLAARKKLGGPFPRTDARRQMERYAQKLRQAKMKKARDSVNVEIPMAADGTATQVTVNAATKALALRWVRLARDGLESRFRVRSENPREDLENTLSQMPEEDDWFYGSMRLEGAELNKRGNSLDDDRKSLEAEAAVKIYKIENDLNNHVKERNEEIKRERDLFESKVSQQIDRINLDVELRQDELVKLKEAKKIEFKGIEKKAREERRKASAGDNVARIRMEVGRKVKNFEKEWQGLTAKWLQVGKRKVAIKKKDDDDAKVGKRKKKGGG
jgi:hypothetical protein